MKWLASDGRVLETIGPEGDYANPRISPDQQRLAFRRSVSGNYDIWLQELGTGATNRFTFSPEFDTVPVWSPDGRQIAFTSGVPHAIFRRDSSGRRPPELLMEGKPNRFAIDWSRDGRFLLYSQVDGTTATDLWVLPLAGDRKPHGCCSKSIQR
jgi:Tol biopolymer transport system component